MLSMLIGTVILLLTLLGYPAFRMGRKPSGAPDKVRVPEGGSVLLCLGDSITHGHMGASWVASLRERFAPAGRVVANGGINGQQVWNIAQRLDSALECEPDMAVLMIGTNDVMAAHRPDLAELYVKVNKLPRSPDLEWSIAELSELVSRLKAAVPSVALCTVPPLGDDPEDELAGHVARYNDAVRSLARAHSCVLLDVHEAMRPLLGADRRPFDADPKAGMRHTAHMAVSHYLLGRSWDAIAQSMGFGATVEGVHLTDTAAARVADLVTGFVQDARATALAAPSMTF